MLPDESKLENIWRLQPEVTGNSFFEFGRRYLFEFLPLGFISRVVIGIFNAFGIPPEYHLWKHGLAFRLSMTTTSMQLSPGTRAIILRFDPQRREFNLFIRATDFPMAEQSLKTAVDVIEQIISGFYATYSSHIERLLVCSHCLQMHQLQQHGKDVLSEASGSSTTLARTTSPGRRLPQITYFPLVKFARALNDQRSPFLVCGKDEVPVPLHHLAPDLALTNLQVLTDVNTATMLGQGGFGSVWKGNWRGREVAVKELKHSEESCTADSTQRFLSFQKEVALMALLQHPNLLRLHGVMLKPLRMVLGKRNPSSTLNFSLIFFFFPSYRACANGRSLSAIT